MAVMVQQRYAKTCSFIHTLSFVTFEQWMLNLWHHQQCAEHFSLPRVLTPWQELVIWQQVAQGYEQAQKLKKAWTRMHEWAIAPKKMMLTLGDERYWVQESFLQFKRHCQHKGYISQSELPALVKVPPTVCLKVYGIVSLPLHHAFYKKHKHCVTFFNATARAQAMHALAPSALSQYEAMALWAVKQHIDQPLASIHCAIPQLSQHVSTLHRVFSHLCYEYGLARDTFCLTKGEPLVQWGGIAFALDMVTMGGGEFSKTSLPHLLRSPFITGSATETAHRWKLAQSLTSAVHDKFTYSALSKYLESYLSPVPQVLHDLLPIIASIDTQGFFPIETWTRIFLDLIAPMIGHPRATWYVAWLGALNALEGADLPPLTYGQALSHLKAYLTITAPSPPLAAPIMIGDVEEVVSVDYLWLADVDEHWPFPYAKGQNTVAYTKQLFSHMMTRASHIISSHDASIRSKNIQFVLSPTLVLHPWIPLPRAALSPIIDKDLPRVVAAKGASLIFKWQALCPFKAYAIGRLGLKEPYSGHGLTRVTQGLILHHVLEKLWRDLKTQAQLIQLSPSALKRKIMACTRKALQALPAIPPLPKKIVDLEITRITQLVTAWLALDRQREPFSTECEARLSLTLGGLTVNLRIDRIDHTATGSLIIDYKSSYESLMPLFELPLVKPQLALYWLAYTQATGIALGIIDASWVSLIGISPALALPPGLKPKLQGQTIEHFIAAQKVMWQEYFTALAQDYCQGISSVTPKYVSLCKTCHLTSLCRIREEYG